MIEETTVQMPVRTWLFADAEDKGNWPDCDISWTWRWELIDDDEEPYQEYIRADIARRLRRALVRARQDGYVDPDLLAETKWLEVER